MPGIPLRDIIAGAQLESYRMRHYFIGVEHLFIAMLKLKTGMTTHLLEDHGVAAEYVINKIRLKVGKGTPGQSVPYLNFPHTPRVQLILRYTEQVSLQNHHPEPEERDLLLAILGERESMPVRVLMALDLDIDGLFTAAKTRKIGAGIHEPTIRTEYGPDYEGERDHEFPKSYVKVLRRMFRGYAAIRMERQLAGSYTRARLYVVTPILADRTEHAAVVVKIARTADILEEARRYDTYVKNMLPPQTSRLEEKPVAPDNNEFAGLKYTLIENSDGKISDLRAVIREWGPHELGRWLMDQLYPMFGKKWWMQNRAYRFEVRKEYDWLLPPVLTLDYLNVNSPPRDSAILSFPIRRYRLASLAHGDTVSLEGFVVQKVDTENRVLTVSMGNYATFDNPYRIKIKNIDRDKVYYPGEVVEGLVGEVSETRDYQMMMAARDLLPDFSLNDEFIPATVDRSLRVNNPLKNYDQLMDWQINGVASKMHGDMHVGNIMIGPNNSPFLIDFARARDGHALFDWATLEISLLSEVVMPAAGDTWDDARRVIEYLARVNAEAKLPESSPITRALAPIVEIRNIAYDIMQRCNDGVVDWREYYIAITMCALRAIHWETMPLASRRLMFLVAGLSIHELRDNPVFVTETPSPDETDVNTNTSV